MRLGYCGWLLAGKRLPEIVDFLAAEGYSSVSWLQDIIDYDRKECEDAAAAIRQHNFTLAFHGNVQGSLNADRKFDRDFAKRVFENVLWWHENTNGVVSCCSDAITAEFPGGQRAFLPDETFQLFQMEADFFEGTGIGYGIENSFCTADSFSYAAPDMMNHFQIRLQNAPNAGMIFDVGHANIYLNRNFPEMQLSDYIRKIPFKIYELHITDNHGERDEHFGPGTGTVDFPELKRAMAERGFDGIISMEVCKDIQHGLYAWDLSKPEEADQVRRFRDDFLRLYNA